MSLPTPQQFRDLVITTEDSVCSQLQKVATFSKLSSDLISEIYNEHGGLTDSFLALVCKLDCVGTQAPAGPTATTTATTLSAGAVVDNKIYSFVSSGGTLPNSVTSTMYVVNGGVFDTQRLIDVAYQVAVPGNATIVAAALHPTTGILYALGVDGTLEATYALPVTLYTVNKTTGELTSVGAVTVPSAVGTFNPALPYTRGSSMAFNSLTLRFNPEDGQAYILYRPNVMGYIYEFDIETQTMLNPLRLGLPSADVHDTKDIHFGPDGTRYAMSLNAFGTFSLTPDPISPEYAPHSFGATIDAAVTGTYQGAAVGHNGGGGYHMLIRGGGRYHYIMDLQSAYLMLSNVTTANVPPQTTDVNPRKQNLDSKFGAVPMAIAYLIT
jgi:hypothetical protein